MTFFSQVFKFSLYCNHETFIMSKKRIKLNIQHLDLSGYPSRSDLLVGGWLNERWEVRHKARHRQ